MKYIKFILVLTLAFLFSSLSTTHAQVAEVTSRDASMSLGNKPAFVVDMSGANKKMAEKKWKEYMKEYGKVERNKKAKEFYTVQSRIPAVGGASAMNVYCKFEQGKEMTRAFVFVDNGESFISSDDESARGIENFVSGYATLVEKEVAKKEMEGGEKELKNFNKDLSKLEKKNKKLHQEIEKAQKKIEEAERNIEQNLLDQDAARETIETQKGKVEELTEYYNSVGNG